jgi:hypothetical protein
MATGGSTETCACAGGIRKSKARPNATSNVLRKQIVFESFSQGRDGGYTKVKRVVDRLNAAYPGRYVFMLPKDFFATIRSYYHLPH